MEIEKFKELTKNIINADIIFTNHALDMLDFRQISKEEVTDHLINKQKLIFVEEAQNERLNCYFEYSHNYFHRYTIRINNGKVIVITVVKINRELQHKMMRYVKI